MDRKDFFGESLKYGLCACGLMAFNPGNIFSSPDTTPGPEDSKIQKDKEFIVNWLNDLFNTMDEVLDEKTRIKLMEGTGRGCFNRFQFKKDLAIKGKGDLDKLIEAYQENFECWKEGEKVHIRYGATSKQCYCPVANGRPVKEHDLHCECTRMTHQSVFETALGRPFKAEIAESLRRGGKTCHIIINLS
ncbi:MAG: hypothetical protein ACM3S2_20675 [Ignavibacteriales bacterium]